MTSKYKDKDRGRDRDGESSHSLGKGRDRDREWKRSRSGSRHREHRDRERTRGHERDRNRDRDGHRRRSRSKSKERRRRSRSRSRDRRRSRDRGYDRGGSRASDRGSTRGHTESRDNDNSGYDYKGLEFTQSVIESMMSTAANAKSFAELLNSYNTQQQIQQQQQQIQAQKALLEAHNENSQSSDLGRDGPGGSGNNSGSEADSRRRKKKSRWAGGDHDKTFIPGMPTILPAGMTQDQQEAYLVQLQIEEISRKLRTGDLMIPQNPEERSPSPEPIYSSDGKRLNTREFRTRKKLEEQRHQLIQRMQCMNPEFKPPSDYKPPVIRVSDKVLIPQEEHPDINFVGLLIGPRGNTLKAMEKDTGAKIIIRGKGSVKEGKVGRKDGQPLPGEDEPLHAFITASNPEAVKKAVDRIKDVIRQGIEVPEGHNDLRRMQLRELAQLNGTLRETDGPRCTNCGSNEHKSWLCPDKPNVTNNIVCSSCGGAGHIAKDCRSKRPGLGGPPANDNQAKIDEEYLSLMAELGEGPPPDTTNQSSSTHTRPSYGLFEPRQAPRPLMQAQAPPIPTTSAPMPHPMAQWSHPALAPVPGPPPPPPQMMGSWGQQPPPPGGASPELMPPGTAPLPRFPQSYPPPPPGISQQPLAPGTGPVSVPSWGGSNGSAVAPPLMPPGSWQPPGGAPGTGHLPPPPMPTGLPPAHLLNAPPPPPPPSS
ncbi:splicing factor 1 isoform X2 [Toxorhynchites rutilus septentrionalis]|uniref:splicing factor 1 isoform X2 n=1 Tax=Toxorhynchites rutilus septentrionalis TaxID=329112 RepID=UPI002479745B|nr:splicing factor 1 isoform X2 [Toxorhynchites rutilus septentrionalis]